MKQQFLRICIQSLNFYLFLLWESQFLQEMKKETRFFRKKEYFLQVFPAAEKNIVSGTCQASSLQRIREILNQFFPTPSIILSQTRGFSFGYSLNPHLDIYLTYILYASKMKKNPIFCKILWCSTFHQELVHSFVCVVRIQTFLLITTY